jgi:outer membrane protein OmpA-like peptidoglycan-associated protein/uncharacterized protein YdeI (BOF family)
MKRMSLLNAFLAVLCLTISGSVLAQDTDQDRNMQQNRTTTDSRSMQERDMHNRMQVASGQKTKLKGIVLTRDNNNSFVLRDTSGSEVNVQMTGNTEIKEKKSNPFRGARKYSQDQVLRGLYVEVEGRGDASGSLVAEKIKFSDDAHIVAMSVNSQVIPVENRVGVAENRLTEAEQNAQRLAGQVEELTQVANLANGGAAAAQKTANEALAGVTAANERISSLDDYEEKKLSTINFKVGSAVLTPDAKAMLDDVATQAKSEKGYVIEVRGFASSDGSTNLNDRLSERRAQAVMRYLAQHEIPLRRIVLPFGYGEAMPVADNTTREGRVQNRRVEVRVLVSRGLVTSPTPNPVSGSGDTQ